MRSRLRIDNTDALKNIGRGRPRKDAVLRKRPHACGGGRSPSILRTPTWPSTPSTRTNTSADPIPVIAKLYKAHRNISWPRRTARYITSHHGATNRRWTERECRNELEALRHTRRP
eukprot:16438289-Heterocapsa_arctica.AAC.1